jgi:recombination protein RecR
MQLPSNLLEQAVTQLAKLPGVGKKTALRLALHLLKQDEQAVTQFTTAISNMRSNTCYCTRCCNISDTALCNICSNPLRNQRIICVVESIKDVVALESTQQFSGTYHVLGGVISPLDGIGPEQLNIEQLVQRVEAEATEEIIFALSPNIQGDTTIYYIQKQLLHLPVTITAIARGIAFGGDLEYADELTLGRSLMNRLPVQQYVKG